MISIDYAMDMAEKYYERETFWHVLRVLSYINENPLIPHEIRERCRILAVMHDLIEDTAYAFEAERELSECEEDLYIYRCLLSLSKNKNETYIAYIKRCKTKSIEYPEIYWVKHADIKDHLAQTETLSDRLKEKYIEALPYFMA